ncbi:MAG: hypothetical protein HYU51_05515 [Candidatus Rokubacteria bacterium]|nr:hypothetical protein [Candidatus Rokubacteria bacterium]
MGLGIDTSALVALDRGQVAWDRRLDALDEELVLPPAWGPSCPKVDALVAQPRDDLAVAATAVHLGLGVSTWLSCAASAITGGTSPLARWTETPRAPRSLSSAARRLSIR